MLELILSVICFTISASGICYLIKRFKFLKGSDAAGITVAAISVFLISGAILLIGYFNFPHFM